MISCRGGTPTEGHGEERPVGCPYMSDGGLVLSSKEDGSKDS